MNRRTLPPEARRRRRILSCAVVFPAALTGVTVVSETAGFRMAAVVLGWLAVAGWGALAVLAARTRPGRPRWTRHERKALRDELDLAGLLRVTPRREGLR